MLYLPSWDDNRQVQQVLKAVQSRKKEDVLNMSGTIGFITTDGFTDLDQYYRKRVNDGIFATLTGSYDYQTINRRIIHEMAASGVRVYDFESGVTRTIDGHVRTLLRTGLSQISHEITSLNMDTMSACYVEVSAHIGARPSHADWQGGVYYWAEKDKTGDGNQAGLPDFIEVTGYGSGPGLCGWNCRHSFFPYFPGLSERTYSKKDLENIDPPPFEYEGRTYTAYEASQRQRQLERTMRKTRRTIIGYQAAGAPDVKVAEQVIRLRRQREAYKRFSRAAKLRPKLERTAVGGYNRSISSKAVWSHRRAQKQAEGAYHLGSPEDSLNLLIKDNRLRRAIQGGAYNLKIHEGRQGKHIKEHNNYSGESYLLEGVDPQELVYKYAGTGEFKRNRGGGDWTNKEFIEADAFIGVVVENGEEMASTKYFSIHYSKDKGTHVVPRLGGLK
ncbi:phage minor capsid protein [Peptococcus simiae]|uniref:phage minor capsid protein n=1 Tax=Peptococcus simiae TaxID=1643805 RepID=UPI00397FDAFF